MSLKLNSSGGGSVTLQEPNTASARTLNLPNVDGTVVSTGDTGTVSANMLASASVTRPKIGYAGAILQVVQTVVSSTLSITANNVYSDITGLSASITPTATSSRILITVQLSFGCTGTTHKAALKRGSTLIALGNSAGSRQTATVPLSNQAYDANQALVAAITFLDSPSSISAQTYQVVTISDNSQTLFVNRSVNDPDNLTGGRYISTITLMEVSG